MSYSLDVNVLLYASDLASDRHKAAREFLDLCATSPEVPTRFALLRGKCLTAGQTCVGGSDDKCADHKKAMVRATWASRLAAVWGSIARVSSGEEDQ